MFAQNHADACTAAIVSMNDVITACNVGGLVLEHSVPLQELSSALFSIIGYLIEELSPNEGATPRFTDGEKTDREKAMRQFQATLNCIVSLSLGRCDINAAVQLAVVLAKRLSTDVLCISSSSSTIRSPKILRSTVNDVLRRERVRQRDLENGKASELLPDEINFASVTPLSVDGRNKLCVSSLALTPWGIVVHVSSGEGCLVAYDIIGMRSESVSEVVMLRTGFFPSSCSWMGYLSERGCIAFWSR